MSQDRAWLASVGERPADAFASAPAADLVTGEPVGWLAAWIGRNKPVRSALRADPAAFDPAGPAGVASLLVLPREVAVIFDDQSVQRARQRLLTSAGEWEAVTTLVGDEVHFRGSLLMAIGDVLPEDPFSVIGPPRRLRLGEGLISRSQLLPAPVIERYAGTPWPQSWFPAS